MWSREGLPAPEEMLRAMYATPPRAYHNASHIDEVLERFDECRHLVTDVGSVFYALLFHDAIYVAGRKDNEEKSADALMAWRPLPKARDIILATAQHGKKKNVDNDTALALDCDMAILGSSPERFALYDKQIEEEYGGGMLYRIGRKKFLSSVLKVERIFLSDFFHARLDAQARANLANALAAQ